MSNHLKPISEQTPEQKFEAVFNLKNYLADNFIQLGQILGEIKSAKLFLFKGYESFGAFVEHEYNLAKALANKLIRIYDLFIIDMDKDDDSLKDVGYDRLGLIAPLVDKADWQTRDELFAKAYELPIPELKAHIKALREEEKNSETDLKKLLVDQFKERIMTNFNCSWPEAQYKLALWFTGINVDAMLQIKDQVKRAQKQFESTLSTSSTPSMEVQQ